MSTEIEIVAYPYDSNQLDALTSLLLVFVKALCQILKFDEFFDHVIFRVVFEDLDVIYLKYVRQKWTGNISICLPIFPRQIVAHRIDKDYRVRLDNNIVLPEKFERLQNATLCYLEVFILCS